MAKLRNVVVEPDFAQAGALACIPCRDDIGRMLPGDRRKLYCCKCQYKPREAGCIMWTDFDAAISRRALDEQNEKLDISLVHPCAWIGCDKQARGGDFCEEHEAEWQSQQVAARWALKRGKGKS